MAVVLRNNLYRVKCTDLKCIAQWMFTNVCIFSNHHSDQDVEHLHYPRKFPLGVITVLSFAITD